MHWIPKLAIGVLIGWAAGEAYRRGATPEQKEQWEGFVNTHHGEAGIVGAALGAAARSPTLAGIGIGLALHDRDDATEWFRG